MTPQAATKYSKRVVGTDGKLAWSHDAVAGTRPEGRVTFARIRRVKVLLPTHQLAAAGIGEVIRGLAESLPAALADSDELIVAGSCPAGLTGANVRCLSSPRMTRTRLGRFVYEQTVVAQLAAGVDLVHLGNTRALLASRAPFVVTVHDLFFFDHPEWYPRWFVAFKRAMFRTALAKEPRAIVCDSQYTQARLAARFPAFDRSRTSVIYPGVFGSVRRTRPDDDVDPYFFTLATFELRKNHLGLARAFQKARARGLRLRWKVAGIEGYNAPSVMAALRSVEGVDVLGPISNEERERLFAGAVFFAFPSHAEGFGFPPLEAMARGVPTICSTGSAMDETVGDAAIRVHSTDLDGWAAALMRLASDGAERARLSELGVERAAQFSWRKAARDYVECYRAAFAGNSR